MNSPSLIPLLTALAIAGLTSCSSVKTSMQKATRPMKALAKTNVERLKNLRFKGQANNAPPVVAVRKEDLREIKSGKEKILAWNRSRQASRTAAVYLPENFDPSSLPVGSALRPSGILPPLSPGEPGNDAPIEAGPDLELPGDVSGE
jgi:hypothetical protein